MQSLSAWMRRVTLPAVPFYEDGRDYDGWDCFGLVYCAWRDVAGVTLPDDYAGRYTTNWKELVRLFDARSTWRKISEARPMAVACIYRRGLPIHCGLVLPNRRIMHVEEGVSTCHEPFSAFRIEGLYLPCA